MLPGTEGWLICASCGTCSSPAATGLQLEESREKRQRSTRCVEEGRGEGGEKEGRGEVCVIEWGTVPQWPLTDDKSSGENSEYVSQCIADSELGVFECSDEECAAKGDDDAQREAADKPVQPLLLGQTETFRIKQSRQRHVEHHVRGAA